MARSLNGSSDLINCGTSAVLNPSAALTACGWVRPTSLSHSISAFISRNGGSTTYQINIQSTGKLAMYVYAVPGGYTYYSGTGTYTLSTNTWYHLALVFSGDNLTGYVNGNLDKSVTFSSRTLGTASASLEFGNDAVNSGRLLQGDIADIAIYNAALTSPQIAALASGIRPPYVGRSSLVGYWPLNGLQSPEPDLSGNVNNGILTGTGLYAGGPPVRLLTKRRPRFLAVPSSNSVDQTLFDITQVVDSTPVNPPAVDQTLFDITQSVASTPTAANPVVQTLFDITQVAASNPLTISTAFSSYWTQAP